MTGKSKVLGQMLVEEGVLTPKRLEAALELQRQGGSRLGTILIREGWVSESALYRILALQLSLPFLPPPIRVHPEARKLVRPTLMKARGIVPVQLRGRTLHVAMADPLDLAALDDLRFQTGRRVEPGVATPSSVQAAIRSGLRDELTDLLGELPRGLGGISGEDRTALERAAQSAPVVRLVDHLLETAVGSGASDLHLEPNPGGVRVRIRVDGVLRTLLDLPAASHRPLLSRLKIMADMDISVRLRPQDGGFAMAGDGVGKTVRVSTLPGEEGEKAVLRILDPARVPAGLEDLGLSERDLGRLRALMALGQGVILTAGPTGSGKSSTLFGALGEVDRKSQNVVTLEDPVEYRLPDITQVQVRSRSGNGFPEALRAILRQDPDVIMVGEIRDRETAEIAMAAAVTGHLVLSTIHTMDAPGAITRLLHMGVPPHLVSAGLSGVVAQRLVRTLCGACRGRGEGCSRCRDGYAGRTGVFQVMVMTEELREATIRNPQGPLLRRLARQGGMGSLEDDARRKVAEGRTTPHEMARVVRAAPGAGSCGACSTPVPSGAAGCPFCGVRLRRLCSCGTEVQGGWKFCPSCLRPAPPALPALVPPP